MLRIYSQPMRRALFWLVVFAATSTSVRADEMRTYVKRGASYQDVQVDLQSAIEGKGLKIGAVGDLGDMFARTQADAGQGQATYKSAHYYQFCSAMLAHKFTEADPTNIGHCPFLMFTYEEVLKPNEIVIGYRAFSRAGSAATRAALDEAETLLDAIAREAAE
jgi:hypothetical protein